MLKHPIYIAIMVFMLLGIPPQGHADSPAKLVDKGNAAYLEGKYDEAISAYDEASINAPESPYIYFNKGAALYQKGDYPGAGEAFEKAALKSKDAQLEAKSQFNLGNCAYREAERQQDSDLNKALEACTKSIRHYQEALALVPDFHEAAENIEMVRLVMKTILDEINKQKEAARQQQQTVEQLKELIEKQQNALERNQQLEGKKNQEGDSRELSEKVQDLAQEQKDMQTETEDLAKKMPGSGSQGAPDTENPTEKHLKNAAKEQQAASGNLEQNHLSEAKNNQEKALNELKDALASLAKDQDKGGGDQAQQKAGGEQGQQEQASSCTDKPSEPQDKDKKQSVQNAAAFSDDAHDILDEEKQNKQQRQYQAAGGYKDVEKDW